MSNISEKIETHLSKTIDEKIVVAKDIKELEKELIAVAKKKGFQYQSSSEMGRGNEIIIRFKK